MSSGSFATASSMPRAYYLPSVRSSSDQSLRTCFQHGVCAAAGAAVTVAAAASTSRVNRNAAARDICSSLPGTGELNLNWL